MDLRLKEVTWVRLISLLLWTLLVMVKQGVSQLIEVLESRVFERSEQTTSEEDRAETEGQATLLPPLSDELVLERIWPLLHKSVNVSLMWRLRRVSRAWKKNVAVTLEWAALEVVRIDSPGYLRFLRDRRERRPSLQERVEDEVRSITVLLSESLVEYSPKSETIRSTTTGHEYDGEDLISAGDLVESGRDCRWIGDIYIGEICSSSESDSGQKVTQWLGENSASSAGSSLRAYFPRHQLMV